MHFYLCDYLKSNGSDSSAYFVDVHVDSMLLGIYLY